MRKVFRFAFSNTINFIASWMMTCCMTNPNIQGNLAWIILVHQIIKWRCENRMARNSGRSSCQEAKRTQEENLWGHSDTVLLTVCSHPTVSTHTGSSCFTIKLCSQEPFRSQSCGFPRENDSQPFTALWASFFHYVTLLSCTLPVASAAENKLMLSWATGDALIEFLK